MWLSFYLITKRKRSFLMTGLGLSEMECFGGLELYDGLLRDKHHHR